jgi:hypothetical protein
VATAEIVMVRKSSDAFFVHVETSMFLYMPPCNATVLQLNWYDMVSYNTDKSLVL